VLTTEFIIDTLTWNRTHITLEGDFGGPMLVGYAGRGLDLMRIFPIWKEIGFFVFKMNTSKSWRFLVDGYYQWLYVAMDGVIGMVDFLLELFSRVLLSTIPFSVLIVMLTHLEK